MQPPLPLFGRSLTTPGLPADLDVEADSALAWHETTVPGQLPRFFSTAITETGARHVIARIPGSGTIAARGTISGYDVGFADPTDDTAIYDFLPAGGAGGSGVDGIPSLQNKLLPLGIEIDAIDMQALKNGWPTEARAEYKDDTLSWLHSDIKNVALTYTWNVMKLAVSRGELDKPVPLKP